jgi:hypothetical protein
VVSQAGGDLGLFMTKCLFAIVTLMIVFSAQREAKNGTVVGLMLAAVCLPDILSVWVSTVRAQVITYLSYAVFLWVFVRARSRGRFEYLLILPLVQVIWVNSHGGFIVGLVFTTIFALAMVVEKRASPMMWVGVVGVFVAPFINAYGVSFLDFIFGAVTHLPPEINEWFALRPWSAHGAIVYGVLLVGLVGSRAHRCVSPEGKLFLVLTAAEGLRHERLAPLFTIATLVYGVPMVDEGVRGLARLAPSASRTFTRSCVAAAVVLTLCASLRLAYFTVVKAPTFSFDYSDYPRSAIEWLRNSREGGKILTHYNDGSYVLWRMGKSFQISLDGRYDGVYPPETIQKGLEVYHPLGETQQEALRFFNPDFILLGPTTPGLCAFESSLRREMYPGFSPAFSDGTFCILERGVERDVREVVSDYPIKVPAWKPLW